MGFPQQNLTVATVVFLKENIPCLFELSSFIGFPKKERSSGKTQNSKYHFSAKSFCKTGTPHASPLQFSTEFIVFSPELLFSVFRRNKRFSVLNGFSAERCAFSTEPFVFFGSTLVCSNPVCALPSHALVQERLPQPIPRCRCAGESWRSKCAPTWDPSSTVGT